MSSIFDENPLRRGPHPGLRLLWPLGIALLGLTLVPLDLPVWQWFVAKRCPAELLRWFSLAETYAHGFGVVCILATVWTLDAGRRRLMPRAIAITFAGALLANVLKMLVVRTRPHDFDLTQPILASFGQWLPLGRVASTSQGFPSAHMATAFGLTAALIWLYPRGRWIFPLFAMMAGFQRISSGSHFTSDVAWGAAAGCLGAALLLPGGLLAARFDRLEKPRANTVSAPTPLAAPQPQAAESIRRDAA